MGGPAQFLGSTRSSSAQAHQQPRENSKAPGLWQDEGSAQHSAWMEPGQESPAALPGLGVLGQVGVLGAQDRNCPWAFEHKSEKGGKHIHNQSGGLVFRLVPPKLVLPMLLPPLSPPVFLPIYS